MPVFFNNQYLNDDDAILHTSDLSIQRGYAVFDFLRTANRQPMFLQDHLDRFFLSAAAMHLKINKSRDELSDIVMQLINQSSFANAGIRLMLTGGYSSDTYNIGDPNLMINCNQLVTPPLIDYENGFSIMTYEHQRELPQIKSTNYLMGVWLQPQLKEKKLNDVLYYKNNIITEFPRANVFIVTKNNILQTPAKNILLGITRKQVLNLAKGLIEVEEKDITLDDLFSADEVFLTSTTKKIMPVVKIDNKKIGNGRPGKIAKRLYADFLLLEH